MFACRVKRDRVHVITVLLTCLGCVQPLACFAMVNWWSESPPEAGETIFYGTLQRAECYTETSDGDDGEAETGMREWCDTTWGFEPRPGKEAFSISQLFAMFTAVLCLGGLTTLTLHTFLEDTLSLLTATAFELGASGMFGLLASIIFGGFYNTIKTPRHSIGPAFYLLLCGSLFCLPAGGLSAWTAIKGGYALWGIGKKQLPDDNDGADTANAAKRPSRDSIDFGDVKVVSQATEEQKDLQSKDAPALSHPTKS
ncbi:hypothetical protein PoB_002774000 [Plakobranchus ocellatus]|uniref:Uncharacterized protein n=1 Tax=Plakobranchus ocellatus TaxID=259542 RepID=A0AAV4A1D9_9GAST|nr:hypothetical protein PoB_002774000 [Plakobranchus ocellatus]